MGDIKPFERPKKVEPPSDPPEDDEDEDVWDLECPECGHDRWILAEYKGCHALICGHCDEDLDPDGLFFVTPP